jgi:tetratricopeptide (TPR) repeat protein/predicted Ser/Thr protein kinase
VDTLREPGSEGDDTPPWSSEDFEQRRAIAGARRKLFGNGPELRIGRYIVEARVGAGGMGEVYRASDPDLGRRVALKRMRFESESESERSRLRNEARALARLSHPNVVQVYEIGEHDGQSFVVMEYVEGPTLRSWVRAHRGWRAVLDAHVEAGRGLAAVHSAGVVHRDFKPDNVLVGPDGRMRVADFGLALDPDAPAKVGEMAGTIRYMSLEQLRGEPVDARSDQFSFCVALYEALWGRAPFDDRSVELRARDLERDEPAVPPRSRVPGSVWLVVRRGLRRDPELRWSTLDELLDRLESIPVRRRRAMSTLIAAPLLGALGVFASRSDHMTSCEDVSVELDDVWSAQRRLDLERTLGSIPAEYAASSAERIGAALDAWATTWVDTRAEQCRAAASERDPPELAHARRRCLDLQRHQVRALVGILLESDREALARGIEAVALLPDPLECSKTWVLDEPEPPPADRIEAIDAVRSTLAELRAQRALGRAAPSIAALALADARALGHRPTIAEALAEQGHTEIAAGSPRRGLAALEEAMDLALGIGHRRLFAEVVTALAMHRVSEYPSPDAKLLLRLAEGAWLDLEPSNRILTSLAYVRAELVGGEEARVQLQQALSTAEDDQRPALLRAIAEDIASHRRAAEAAEAVFGPGHPSTAEFVFNVGIVLRDMGELAQARVELERAAAIWLEAYRKPHPNLARAHLVLAELTMLAGELDLAEAHARKVASIHTATLPVGHRDFGDAPMLLSRIAGLRGDRTSARALAARAIESYERADGPAATAVLQLRLDIAASDLGLGDPRAAELEYLRILELAEQPELVALAHVGLAEIELRRGELTRAREQLDIVEAMGVEVLGQQHLSHAILDALVELRSGCRECASSHADVIAQLGRERGLIGVELWLAELGVTAREAERLGLPSPSP